MTVEPIADLRTHYRPPAPTPANKATPTITAEAARFIEQSPLFVIASTDGSTVDASPRGGPPGFVAVIDERTLAFADLVGNNRLDTYTNMQAVDAIAMIFFVPGLEETLRVNGTAVVTTDDALRQRCTIGDRTPKVAIVITIHECYLHCGAALRRAAFWDPDTAPDPDDLVSSGQILVEALDLDVSASEVESNLADYYDNRVWEVGGDDPEPT